MEAHDQLEELILDRETMETKKKLGSQFAQVVYEGKWFTPLREAIQAFVESTQKYVTGEVKFKLYKGNIIKAGTTSPYSLYNESLASFTTGDMYDHHDADGFITLFGLAMCDIYDGAYDSALENIAQGLKENSKEDEQGLLYNEIVAYEYKRDFATAKEKMKIYLEQYPEDEAALRENEFLSTR